MTDTVDKVIIQSETQGVQQTTDQLNQLGKSMDGVTVSAQNVEKSTGPIDSKFASLERRFQTTSGQAAQLAKIQNTVNTAVAQNPALQERANAVLAAATERYGAAIVAEKALGEAHKGLDAQGQAAFHSIRSIAEQLALGISPTQALTGQINHLTFAASGQGGLAGAFGQVKNFAVGSVTALAAMITPLTAIAAGTVAAGAAAVYLGLQWDNAQKQAERALIGIGASTGTTVTDLRNFAQENSSAFGLSQKEATDLGLEMTKTGEIAVGKLHGIGDAAHGLAVLLDTDAADAGKKLTEVFSGDLAKGVDALSKIYPDFNTNIREQVRELDAAGEKTKAQQLIIDTMAASNVKAAGTVNVLTKAWTGLVNILATKVQGPDVTTEGKLKSAQENLAAARAGDDGSIAAASSIYAAGKAVEEAQAKVDAFNTNKASAEFNKLSLTAQAFSASLLPQTEQIHHLEEALNKLKAAKAAGDTNSDDGIAVATHLLALQQDSYNATVRQAEVANQLSFSYGAVSAQTAITLNNLSQQLNVAQQVTAAAQMQAQAQATVTQLISQGVAAEEAQLIAAKQLEIAQAAATSSVLKQVEALKDSTKMIKAQQDGTEAQTAAAIAYKNAIESGADETAAAALKSATLHNYMARTANETANIAINLASAVDSLDDPAWYNRPATGFTNPNTPGEMTSGGSYPTDPNNPLFINYKYGGRGFNMDTGTGPAAFASTGGSNPDSMDAILSRLAANAYSTGGVDASISAVMARAQTLSGTANTTSVINQLSSLYDFKNSQTGDKSTQASNLQSEIAYLNTLPDTIARDQKIADLRNSIDQLKNSTDGLNSTNQELLSPYYEQDPRTSHIGFRSQGMATGGEITVPGGYSANDNMLASIPVASGEIVSVRRPGQNLNGGNSQTVTINLGGIVVNSGGAPVNKNAIGRTVYQATQNALRQMKAVS